MTTDITPAEDSMLRVRCDQSCDRPLSRTVADRAHATNLAVKHDREWHATADRESDIEALAEALAVADGWADQDEYRVAQGLIDAGYAKPPC